MGISTYNFFDFESQDVVVYFSMILIVTYIMQRRRERRIDRKTQSYLPQLKALAADPNKVREPGEWTSVPFAYPPIRACPVELSSIKPIPYRPFRWGPEYHVTMGIRNMPWEDWIELDNQFIPYYRIRLHRVKTCGADVVRVLPEQPGIVRGACDAVLELVQELAEYLSARYPCTFRIERMIRSETKKRSLEKGWDGRSPIKSITCVPLEVTYELNEDAEDMMKVAALLTQDDLALMIEGEDGRYYFQAGAICVAGFWRMKDKIGMPLDEIHTTGHVPQYRERLEMSLERFFKRLPVDKPVIRNNYFIQIVRPDEDRNATSIVASDENANFDPEELAWSSTVNGPEEDFGRGHRVHGISGQTLHVSPSTLRLRTERQTLRRLPKSGAILFTIRTYTFPVTELVKERGVPARMASAIRSWPADVATYKGQARYKDVLLEYLDECARKQAAKGEVGQEERVQAGYPF